MTGSEIVRIEWARLSAERPRVAGSNARLGEHGRRIAVPIARVTTHDGRQGFGRAAVPEPHLATSLLGRGLEDLFAPEGEPIRVLDPFLPLEFPLWDLRAASLGLPVYRLLAPGWSAGPLQAPCYDTSLYFDDLHLADDAAAAELLAGEVRQGWERGHRAFKMKVGRGSRHMSLEAGARRDLAVVRAVREAVGPDTPLMLDANNGWNLNLARRFIEATADPGIYWLEEPFHEDDVLYRDLKGWMSARGIGTLIADGEGSAHPRLLDWARDGSVDVVQYDIFGHGLSRWLETGRALDGWGARSAPHHYGCFLGNYVSAHLAAAIQGFTFVEWDEASAPWLEASGYRIEAGRVAVPDAPGFGLALDDDAFTAAVSDGGYRLSLS